MINNLGKSFLKLNKSCLLKLVCLVVLIYLCYNYVLPRLKEGLEDGPVLCNKTFPRFKADGGVHKCPTGFKGIACSGGCPIKPAAFPNTNDSGMTITDWDDQCGCWYDQDSTEKNELYSYSGENKDKYDSGLFSEVISLFQTAVNPSNGIIYVAAPE